MTSKSRKARRPPKTREPWWVGLGTEELLDVRLCDLELELEGSVLGQRVERLYDELARKGLVYRPYVWLADDWFTPEGATGFALPFYLAHPRLVRLEHNEMFEAEGSTQVQCMRLLRHETAHAIDNAYRLHRRRDWRAAFGRYSDPYKTNYQPIPTSKNYVQNLGHWYGQSHPAEDWAETFSVWLAPNSRWRSVYAGWPALKKLRAVDAMMKEAGPKRQLVKTRNRDDSLPKLRMTLREHYRRKKAFYDIRQPWRHDRQLRMIFTMPGAAKDIAGADRASTFLRGIRVDLRGKVSTLTGAHRYVVDEALNSMVRRCRELDLRLCRPRGQARLGAAVLLAMITLSLANGGRPRFAR